MSLVSLKQHIARVVPLSRLQALRKRYDSFLYEKRDSVEGLGNEGSMRHMDTSRLNEHSIVYSAGVGGAMSFELELTDRFGCQIFLFDPSPIGEQTATDASNIRSSIHFFPRGIAGQDGTVHFGVASEDTGNCFTLAGATDTQETSSFPCRSISSLMKERGHDHIDLLKMDIEGFEYEVLEDLWMHGITPHQICLEFHDFFPHIPRSKTTQAIAKLKQLGYTRVYKHMQDMTFVRDPKISCITISRWHIFDFAKALSAIVPFQQFISAFPGVRRFGIKARDVRIYRRCNYYLTQLLSFFPIVRTWKNRYVWQTNLFQKAIMHDYKRADLLVTNLSSADSLIDQAKAAGTKIVLEVGSTWMEKQNKLLQEEYARRGKSRSDLNQKLVENSRLLIEKADRISIPSQFVRDSFVEYGFDMTKFFLNPYGVNTDIFHDRGGRRTDKFILISAGSQELRKGTLYNLQAREQLALPNAEFRVVGNILPDVADLLGPYKNNPSIKFIRSQSWNSLAKLFSQASCFVISSIEEGLAVTQLQAMACGLPVISNPNCGGENCIQEGQNGFIVEVRNVDQIAEKIRYLSEHPAERNRMSTQAVSSIQERHTRDRYAKNAYKIYTEILSSSS